MSRSRKKNAITGITTAVSEKWDKQNTNRRMRKGVKNKMAVGDFENLPTRGIEIEDSWCFAKDGKNYYDKDDKYYKKVIRK